MIDSYITQHKRNASVYDVCPMSPYWDHARIQRWGGGGGGQGVQLPLINHKNIGFLSSTSSDPLKNHKAPKPAFNAGP